jgi:phage shock protein PspC (stress-responsive transcriptional regulator)
MSEVRCELAMAALVRFIETGEAMPDRYREHLRECERCRAMLGEATAFEQDLELEDATADDRGTLNAEAAAKESMRLQRERRAKHFVVIAFATLIFGMLLILPMFDEDTNAQEALLAGSTGIAIAILFASPFIALMTFAREQRGSKLYKRLGTGRQLSGVCLGLAERTGWPVMLIRLIFLALIFVKGAGIVLYLAFDLAMPMHPADRGNLLRFRIARKFRRPTAERL